MKLFNAAKLIRVMNRLSASEKPKKPVTTMASTSRADFIVSEPKDVQIIQKKQDLRRVVVRTKKLKYRGLLPIALKYSFFALAEGGHLEIFDEPDAGPVSPPFKINFSLVRLWVFSYLGRDTKLCEFDTNAGRILLQRTKPITEPGWSVGIVFSGSSNEIANLHTCISAILTQEGFSDADGLSLNELIVCGPSEASHVVHRYSSVKYLPFDGAETERFEICKKKNFLMSHMKRPRLAVLHTRIILQPGSLSRVPREFDVLSPNVSIIRGGRRVPYLSLGVSDTGILGRMPSLPPASLGHFRARGGVDTLRRKYPLYVDGGAFFVMQGVAKQCPLNEALAWGENEDGEWCARLRSQGFLLDLAEDCAAISLTSKFPVRPSLPFGLQHVAIASYRLIRRSIQAVYHYVLRIMNVR